VRHAFAAIAFRLLSSSKMVAAGALALAIGFAPHHASAADSRSAAIVIDVKTGKTLYSANAESRRYPASLTKMMTLYITFEALAAGKISKKTRIPFSAQAASRPPTKLGVKAGNSVTVETAIYALVTKSANDAASALGEYFAGSEAAFARKMTAKARSLGMASTVFRNPHGLPDAGQFTTAHDMARLGIALRRDFPQYYSYFSTRSFTYGRKRMANHNRLLGRVKGVDGIKTGYTRASGFNIVTSVSDGNRRIVGVVMGGASGASRDRQMAELIRKYLPKASTKGSDLIASASSPRAKAQVDVVVPRSLVQEQEEQIAEGDTEDGAEELVVSAPAGKQVEAAKAEAAITQALAEPAPRPKAEIDEVLTASVPSSGWVVQVASSPSKAEAVAAIAKTSRQAPSILAADAGFTTTFDKAGVTYYRARFGGFKSKTSAWNACNTLKKKKIACYAVEN
jgi:D-alanyl-D-alanine carboxypeptidase